MSDILSASLSIAPVLQTKPTTATGYIDVGSPSSLDLQLTDLTYKTDIITYTGFDLTDLSTSGSTLSGYTFPNAFGEDFGLPRGFEMIRIKIERIEGSGSPDSAHPITIVLTGPGLPELSAEYYGPAEIVLYQKIGSLPDLDGSTSHIAATVPTENQAILKLTVQLKAWKDA